MAIAGPIILGNCPEISEKPLPFPIFTGDEIVCCIDLIASKNIPSVIFTSINSVIMKMISYSGNISHKKEIINAKASCNKITLIITVFLGKESSKFPINGETIICTIRIAIITPPKISRPDGVRLRLTIAKISNGINATRNNDLNEL
jgi:hypothetical protein